MQQIEGMESVEMHSSENDMSPMKEAKSLEMAEMPLREPAALHDEPVMFGLDHSQHDAV